MSDISKVERKGACCHDVLTGLLDLSPSDLDVFFLLLRTPSLKVDDIAELCGKHRSTVFRILQKLESSGLVFRDTMTLKEGGYFHVYSLQDVGTLERIVGERARELIDALNKRVDEFSNDLRHIVVGMPVKSK